MPNMSPQKKVNVWSRFVKLRMTRKLTAIARPTPGSAKASRIACTLRGASLRRGVVARFSGGRDSATPKATQARLTTLRHAATRHGTSGDGYLRERAADPRAEDEPETEGHADEPHALRAILGLRDVGDVRARG